MSMTVKPPFGSYQDNYQGQYSDQPMQNFDEDEFSKADTSTPQIDSSPVQGTFTNFNTIHATPNVTSHGFFRTPGSEVSPTICGPEFNYNNSMSSLPHFYVNQNLSSPAEYHDFSPVSSKSRSNSAQQLGLGLDFEEKHDPLATNLFGLQEVHEETQKRIQQEAQIKQTPLQTQIQTQLQTQLQIQTQPQTQIQTVQPQIQTVQPQSTQAIQPAETLGKIPILPPNPPYETITSVPGETESADSPTTIEVNSTHLSPYVNLEDMPETSVVADEYLYNLSLSPHEELDSFNASLSDNPEYKDILSEISTILQEEPRPPLKSRKSVSALNTTKVTKKTLKKASSFSCINPKKKPQAGQLKKKSSFHESSQKFPTFALSNGLNGISFVYETGQDEMMDTTLKKSKSSGNLRKEPKKILKSMESGMTEFQIDLGKRS